MSSITNNCCICCENSLFLGCVSTCLELSLGVVAPSAGTYYLQTEFAGKLIQIEGEFEQGEILSFDISGLNENYTYSAQLLDTNCAPLCYSYEQITYDCLTFKTQTGLCKNPAVPIFSLKSC